MDHNIRLAALAQSCGLRWAPPVGLVEQPTGRILNTPDKAAFFAAISLHCLPPEHREWQPR